MFVFAWCYVTPKKATEEVRFSQFPVIMVWRMNVVEAGFHLLCFKYRYRQRGKMVHANNTPWVSATPITK